MKINEVTAKSDKVLFEELDKNNDTGFLTEDLVKIVRTHETGSWTKPVTIDEFLAEMDSWENK